MAPMEPHKAPPLPFKGIIISLVLLLVVVFYSLRNVDVVELDVEEATVSICQVRVHIDAAYNFDDRTLVSLLAKLKRHDFHIGQPIWGTTDTLLYFCEHRLKGGLKQKLLDKELNNVIKNGPYSSGRLAWSCA